MNTYAFSVTVTGLDLDDTSQLDSLHTEGFVLVPGSIDGVVTIDVEADATSGQEALKMLTDHLEAHPEIVIQRLDEDLVNVPEIANRLDFNRETVRLWTTGGRREADFPAHRTVLAGGQKIWAWADVYAWAEVRGRLPDDLPMPLDVQCVDWFNGNLTPRARRPHRVSDTGRVLAVIKGPGQWTRTAQSSLHVPAEPSTYEARDGSGWISTGQAVQRIYEAAAL